MPLQQQAHVGVFHELNVRGVNTSVSDDAGAVRHCEPGPLCGERAYPTLESLKEEFSHSRICLSICLSPYLLCVCGGGIDM